MRHGGLSPVHGLGTLTPTQQYVNRPGPAVVRPSRDKSEDDPFERAAVQPKRHVFFEDWKAVRRVESPAMDDEDAPQAGSMAV